MVYLKICRQATVIIAGDAQPKIRQRLYWGSDEWIQSYKRRTRVEGILGIWKAPSKANLKRGWTRVVGIVKTMLMLVFFVAAKNIACLRTWGEAHDDHGHWLMAADPVDYGFEERETDYFEGEPHAPPSAA